MIVDINHSCAQRCSRGSRPHAKFLLCCNAVYGLQVTSLKWTRSSLPWDRYDAYWCSRTDIVPCRILSSISDTGMASALVNHISPASIPPPPPPPIMFLFSCSPNKSWSIFRIVNVSFALVNPLRLIITVLTILNGLTWVSSVPCATYYCFIQGRN